MTGFDWTLLTAVVSVVGGVAVFGMFIAWLEER